MVRTIRVKDICLCGRSWKLREIGLGLGLGLVRVFPKIKVKVFFYIRIEHVEGFSEHPFLDLLVSRFPRYGQKTLFIFENQFFAFTGFRWAFLKIPKLGMDRTHQIG